MDFDKVYEASLYRRSDPLSEEAFYDIELPDTNQEVVYDYKSYSFVWDREKSNDNVRYHGFSHYLTAILYDDTYVIYDGDYVNGKNVRIKTSKDNEGAILSSYDIETGNYKKDTLILIKQLSLDHGRIRLITCYPTNNEYYSSIYWERRLELQENEKDTKNIREWKRNQKQNVLIKRGIESSLRAYRTFLQKITSRSVRW